MEKKRRQRVKHEVSLEERLEQEAQRLRRRAHHEPAGPARDALFEKARQMDEARSISELLASPSSFSFQP